MNVPTFSLGMNDGYAIRDLIGMAGGAPRLQVRLDVKMVPDRKTGTVWGTLPGTTDETIYILAHHDGWFDSGDRQRVGRRDDGRARRVLLKDSAGAAPPHDGLPRHERPSQQRQHERRRGCSSTATSCSRKRRC